MHLRPFVPTWDAPPHVVGRLADQTWIILELTHEEPAGVLHFRQVAGPYITEATLHAAIGVFNSLGVFIPASSEETFPDDDSDPAGPAPD